jgi:hypothetical protein
MNHDTCIICALTATQPTSDNDDTHEWLPQPLAMLWPTDDKDCPPTSIICDTAHPAPESRPHFGAQLGCTFKDRHGATRMRLLSDTEILSTYSYPPELQAALIANHGMSPFLPSLAYSCPFGLAQACTDTIFSLVLSPITDDHTSGHNSFTQCLAYTAKPPPTTADWMVAYLADPSTALIIANIGKTTAHTWTKLELNSIESPYRDYLRSGSVSLLDGKLVLHQALDHQSRTLTLIIVPAPLRRDIFSAYHASPMTGHMGVYKTLHRLRLRFFWPKIRTDVTAWVDQCAHCIAANSHIRKNSELLFSWPVSCPFYILHIDLWQPGSTTNELNDSSYILAGMCDLTGFVITTDTSEITSHNLSILFMKHFLLKIGLCGLVVVDAASSFLSVFESMCSILGIKFHAAARGNHKAVSVERFFRFLNKLLTIHSNDRATNQVFIETSECAAYAWNSSAIDGTDIIRSVAAVGREFKFPLDINLGSTPIPVDSDVFAVHSFLRLAQTNSQFAIETLRILTEERRTYHRERANESRSHQLFELNDIVMVRVQDQSNLDTNRVAKLSYRLRGPYSVIETLGHGAYIVQKVNQPHAPKLKYHTQDISLLPPAIRPVEPLDGPDLRYLNNSHAPIPHPLKAAFNIDRYDSIWFSKPHLSSPPHFPLCTTNPISFTQSTQLLQELSPTPLRDDYRVPIVQDTTHAPTPTPNALQLFTAIASSTDKLFFVAYTDAGTLRPCWFLISVDLSQTVKDARCTNHTSTGIYYCHFYLKHPNDRNEPDHNARWWPEWHLFTTGSDSIIDYGASVLFPPTHTPNPSKYIAWADTISLCHPTTHLLGPFDMEPPYSRPNQSTPSYKQYLSIDLWTSLGDICLDRGITPPHLSVFPSITPRTRSNKRRLST